MTIEEIRKAKQEAEARIREVLQQLEVQTGLKLAAIEFRATPERFGPTPPFSVVRVGIVLQLP